MDMPVTRGSGAAVNSGSPIRATIAFAVGSLVALSFVFLARGHAQDAAESPRGFRVHVTGDTRGYLDPCGCDRGVQGGVPRRATALATSRLPGDLLLDTGNITRGEGAMARLRMEYSLRAFELLEYDYLIPGEGELALGKTYEEFVAKLERPAPICANLRLSSTDKHVFRRFAVHTTAAGRRIGIIGVTSTIQRVSDRYKVDPVAEAVAEVSAELSPQVDALIIAGHIEGVPALGLAKAFPAALLVAASRAPSGSESLLRRGGAPVLIAGERGQYLATVHVEDELAAKASSFTWLDESVADEPEAARLVATYYDSAAVHGDRAAATTLAEFRERGRVGSGACLSCHAEAHATWLTTRHAAAMRSLHHKGKQRVPECMACHLQDRPASDDPNALLQLGVGCEACHGPGRDHVELHRAAGPEPAAAKQAPSLLGDARASCAVCHDPANSPEFDFNTYWKRVRHGTTEESSR